MKGFHRRCPYRSLLMVSRSRRRLHSGSNRCVPGPPTSGIPESHRTAPWRGKESGGQEATWGMWELSAAHMHIQLAVGSLTHPLPGSIGSTALVGGRSALIRDGATRTDPSLRPHIRHLEENPNKTVRTQTQPTDGSSEQENREWRRRLASAGPTHGVSSPASRMSCGGPIVSTCFHRASSVPHMNPHRQ